MRLKLTTVHRIRVLMEHVLAELWDSIASMKSTIKKKKKIRQNLFKNINHKAVMLDTRAHFVKSISMSVIPVHV